MLVKQKWPSLTNEVVIAFRHLTVNITDAWRTLLGTSELSPKNDAAAGGLQNPFTKLQLWFLLSDEKLTRRVIFHVKRETAACHWRMSPSSVAVTPGLPTLTRQPHPPSSPQDWFWAEQLNEHYGVNYLLQILSTLIIPLVLHRSEKSA